jgi:hypothetical protein
VYNTTGTVAVQILLWGLLEQIAKKNGMDAEKRHTFSESKKIENLNVFFDYICDCFGLFSLQICKDL